MLWKQTTFTYKLVFLFQGRFFWFRALVGLMNIYFAVSDFVVLFWFTFASIISCMGIFCLFLTFECHDQVWIELLECKVLLIFWLGGVICLLLRISTHNFYAQLSCSWVLYERLIFCRGLFMDQISELLKVFLRTNVICIWGGCLIYRLPRPMDPDRF